ncbi:hypothetical protein FAM09_26775 [Niastella caeni]|uniref:Uncharacterized protein n=1 Tax=Niastella caeni TaxID=2569763 RepID=A0A4S8HBS3_9BACT|nr:hypothetical protein [Niastella caeni]THU32400.1 hypothetical protein FAM09_26775 [Niastella caeni]
MSYVKIKPTLVIGNAAIDLSKVDWSNLDNNPELKAKLEAWTEKKLKAFERAEKRKYNPYDRSIGRKRSTPRKRK